MMRIWGRQEPPRAGVLSTKPLVFGQSITDACLGWEDSEALLNEMAEHVRTARAHR